MLVRSALGWVAIGIALGTVASACWLARQAGAATALQGKTLSECRLKVVGDPRSSSFGYSCVVDVEDAATGTHLARVSATLKEEPLAGSELRAVGSFAPLKDDDWSKSRYMKGEVASARVASIVDERRPGVLSLQGVRNRMLSVIDPQGSEARALIAGTICGRTTELSGTQANEMFSCCGLSHLVAVSGSHLAFIAALLEFAMGRLRIAGVTRRALLMFVMAVYVVFTGGAPSAVRSVSMVGLASAAVLGGRRPHAVSGLMLAVVCMVLLNPGVVFDIGFQLSALSVLFILVFAPYVAYALRVVWVPKSLAEVMSLTLVAQWATIPVTLPVFGELSLIALVSNIVVGPVMTALLVVGLVTVPLAALLPSISGLLAPVELLANTSIFIARAFAAVPYASIGADPAWWLPLAAFGAAGVLYLIWPRVSRAPACIAFAIACAACALHVARWTAFAPPSVTVLDIGQGDSILIRDGSDSVLVDAGIDEATRRALARNHVWHLDAVVITHWDRDHWGGLPEALSGVQVDRLVVASGAADALPPELADLEESMVEVRQGDTLHVGGFTCSVVCPSSKVSDEENAESLCLDVSYDAQGESLRMLLTGDTERDELEQYADQVGDIDVLKMGHHGSRVSVSSEAMAVLNPELSVASAGEGNSYGHPDPDCVRIAEESGSLFICTKDVGDVTLYPEAGVPRVCVQRGPMGS
ncbi:MAG: DNA internalization-related competence protein ComEC/Rec2 [Coriobacteriaceae bacterium]|nr:DNA internalization-related competence protein ComEC/Rec2 [Coriobacteriaceae bacterium]